MSTDLEVEAAAEITRLREEVEGLKSEESCNDVLLEYAQAENQRLREENARLRQLNCNLIRKDECDELRAENERLREALKEWRND
jgi:FtsZ-binding cell division protein ZapB